MGDAGWAHRWRRDARAGGAARAARRGGLDTDARCAAGPPRRLRDALGLRHPAGGGVGRRSARARAQPGGGGEHPPHPGQRDAARRCAAAQPRERCRAPGAAHAGRRALDRGADRGVHLPVPRMVPAGARDARGALRPAGVRVEVTSVSVHDALRGLTVLERGWLSSNNVLVHPVGDEPGALLVDTGHVVHAAQTVALVRHALRGAPLARIVNTHLHSDHCGGNAALQRAFGAPITVPPGNADAVSAWDTMRLTHASTGQRSERFTYTDTLASGASFVAGGRRWDALAA